MSLPTRIVLIGPSGSGKSETARHLAGRTGRAVIDTDDLIVKRTGMSIAEIFERFGEPAFRALESEVLRSACAEHDVIVSTGGGAVLDPANWAVMRPRSVIVALTAPAETLVTRVAAHESRSGREAERPLLSGDALARMSALLISRSALYAQADSTIDTLSLSPVEVADAVLAICTDRVSRGLSPVLSLSTPTGRSDIYVGRGVLSNAATLIRSRWPSAKRVWLVSDSAVHRLWGDEVTDGLAAAGLEPLSLVVPAGESSKSFAEVERLCVEMTGGGASRRDVVLALGGGVVGDLAGFVAAICLRGLPLVQVPTSLLAMVDSSVGGKTGVNLPAGKNLTGAFYQPGVVLIDPDFLRSLPAAEYRSGMAEVIKHSVIQPTTPLGGTSLREQLSSVPLDPIPDDAIERTLALNVAIKHSVVQQDERESGPRMMLNLGHTAGHAIEASGYRRRHGEAIAIGLAVVFRVAQALGRVSDADVERIESMLSRAGLPITFDEDIDEVVSRLARDKKNVDGSLHWVLPRAGGGADIVIGVPSETVLSALRAVWSPNRTAGRGSAVL